MDVFNLYIYMYIIIYVHCNVLLLPFEIIYSSITFNYNTVFSSLMATLFSGLGDPPAKVKLFMAPGGM